MVVPLEGYTPDAFGYLHEGNVLDPLIEDVSSQELSHNSLSWHLYSLIVMYLVLRGWVLLFPY